MGREIVYCSQCGVRILEKDLAAGRAFTVLDKVFCAECRDQAFTQGAAPEPPPAKMVAGRPPGRPPMPAARKSGSPVARLPAVVRGSVGMAPPEGAPAAPRMVAKKSNPMPLYIGSAVGLVGLVVIIVLVMLSGGDKGKATAKNGPSSTSDGSSSPSGANDPKLSREDRAARRLSDLQQFATVNTDPAAVVKKAAEAEKDIVGTPTEEAYRTFRKRWERKIEEAEATKKIDALLLQVKAKAAGDPPEFKIHGELLDLLLKAKELAIEHGSEKAADVENLRREVDEPYEAAADAWFEKNGQSIKQWMSESEFKGALKYIDTFPEALKLSKVWRVNLTKWREDCVKGQAAKEALAAGKEPVREWTYYLRLAGEDLQRKNYAKAKENYLKAEAAMPKFEAPSDDDKRRVAWALYYNFGCLYADWSKKLEGEEKTKAVDSAFAYLQKSAEAGVFELTCRCGDRDHKVARDHWDKDVDLEKIRGDARYGELIKKYAK